MATLSSRPKTGSAFARNGPLDQSLPPEYTYKVMKKISQLTKVIYQLNTRNEEHDNFVLHLKSMNEDDTKRLSKQNGEMLKGLETRHSLELNALKEHVASCNDQIALLDNDKTLMKQDNVDLRQKHVTEMAELKEANLQRVKDLSVRLAVVRKDLTDTRAKISTLEQWYEGSLEETVKEVKTRCSIEREAIVREREHYKEEFIRQGDCHRIELEKMRGEFEAKLKDQLRESSRSHDALIARMMQESKDKEQSFMESSTTECVKLNEMNSKLSAALREAKDRYTTAEQQLRELEVLREEGKSSTTVLEGRLREARSEQDLLRRKVSDLKLKLEIEQEKYQQQSKEMTSMSANVARLEAACADDSAKVKDLHASLESVRADLRSAKLERDALLSSHTSSAKEQQATILSLSQEVKKLQKDKEDLSVQYGREIEVAQAKLSAYEGEMNTRHLEVLQDARAQMEALKASHKSALQSLTEELTAAGKEELCKAESLFKVQIRAVEERLSEAQGALLKKEEEVSSLQRILKDSNNFLGTASEQVSRLEGDLAAAKGELSKIRSNLGRKETECESLKVDVANLQAQLETTVRKYEAQLATQKDLIGKGMEELWLQRIKEECSSLRKELQERHRRDSQAAVEELVLRKEEEMKAIRNKWTAELDQLNRKIAEYKDQLRAVEQRANMDREASGVSFEERMRKLREELERERSSYQLSVSDLQAKHSCEMEQLRAENAASLKDLEERMASVHAQEIQTTRLAEKIASDVLRDQLRRENQSALDQHTQEHKQATELLKQELELSHQDHLERLRGESKDHLEQVRQTLNSELEQRETELVRHASTIDVLNGRLKDEQSVKENHLKEVLDLRRGVKDLRRELERKGDELLVVRREANNQMRQREQQLIAAHQVEVESLIAHNQKQLKSFLEDFNTAKEMLNDEIGSLSEQLSEAEKRFSHRTSLPEDLETIRELRKIISQQEFRLKEVIAETKLYRMELVNREKNYNKVFSASPMVGVLDPLAVKDKKKSSRDHGLSGSRHSSAPTLVSPISISNDQTGNASLTDSPLLQHKRVTASKTTVFQT